MIRNLTKLTTYFETLKTLSQVLMKNVCLTAIVASFVALGSIIYIWSNPLLRLSLEIDELSLIFLLLTTLIFPICYVAVGPTNRNVVLFILASLEALLIISFCVSDMLYFFVSFEAILIPMYYLIVRWGGRTRKIKAGYFFFLFTMLGSLFMLFAIMYIYTITGSTSFDVIFNMHFTLAEQKFLWLCFFIAFAVKIPMFPLHIWLPEAHVEAPTIGSVILASLLLKLGGYGFLRFNIQICAEATAYYSPLINTLCIIGIVYASLVTIRQVDLKRIIAYSSIAHMNLIVLGLFSNVQQGLDGAIYLMVGHGLVSSGLFFCVGVLYDRYHSRLLRYYGGLTQTMPLFSAVLFIFTLGNMGFPTTCNFIGEFLILAGLFQENMPITILAGSGIVLGAIYSIWLFNRLCFGTLKIKYIYGLNTTSVAQNNLINKYVFTDLHRGEIAVFAPLIVLTFLLGVSSTPVLDLLHPYVNTLLITSF